MERGLRLVEELLAADEACVPKVRPQIMVPIRTRTAPRMRMYGILRACLRYIGSAVAPGEGPLVAVSTLQELYLLLRFR
jgi:hypothetical protein